MEPTTIFRGGKGGRRSARLTAENPLKTFFQKPLDNTLAQVYNGTR